jgi:AI-2 transport protein TqsA
MASTRPNRAFLLLLGLIATVLLGWVLHVGAEIIQPIVIALLMASMLRPIVLMLARRGIPPALTVLALTTVLFLVLFQVGMIIQQNITQFLTNTGEVAVVDDESGQPGDNELVLPDENGELDPTPEDIEDAANPDGATHEATDGPSAEDEEPGPTGKELEATTGWTSIVEDFCRRITESERIPEDGKGYLIKILRDMDPAAIAEGIALSGVDFVKTLLLVLIYMVFIFAEQAIFRRKILAIAGDRQGDAAEILERIGRGIQRYLGVKTVVSFLTGALCYLVLVTLEIPYALLFGFLTFLLNYIPTFGSIIASIPPTFTALAIDSDPTKAVVVLVTYLAVNLTLGSFIEPRILGRELNLSPLVVVISVVVWAGLWGVVGGFLAVPLTAALQITLASNEATRPIAIMLGSGPPRDKKRGKSGGVGVPTG